jgi:hypothetical protein
VWRGALLLPQLQASARSVEVGIALGQHAARLGAQGLTGRQRPLGVEVLCLQLNVAIWLRDCRSLVANPEILCRGGFIGPLVLSTSPSLAVSWGDHRLATVLT